MYVIDTWQCEGFGSNYAVFPKDVLWLCSYNEEICCKETCNVKRKINQWGSLLNKTYSVIHATLGEGTALRLPTNPEPENHPPCFFLPWLHIFVSLIIFIMLYSQDTNVFVLCLLCKYIFLCLELGVHSTEAQLIGYTQGKVYTYSLFENKQLKRLN